MTFSLKSFPFVLSALGTTLNIQNTRKREKKEKRKERMPRAKA
jgi:hypothetical protein